MEFFSFERMVRIWMKYSSFYINGLENTLLLSFFAVLCGLLFGFIIATGRMGRIRVFRWLCAAYVEILRSTPLLVQVIIFYYGSNSIGLKFANANFNAFFWGLVAVSLNSGAYMSEVIRSGIGAVDAGQLEAARAIGMTQGKAMRYIVLPQAIRNILPATCNEFITIIKETSVLTMVGIHEIMFRAGDVASLSFRYVEPYVIAAILYFIIAFPLSKLVGLLERRLRRSVTR
jgi:His/Glu/Gln/Arg/opine family amino acid ABC transporter permease subunit